jgi:hypothetical protein
VFYTCSLTDQAKILYHKKTFNKFLLLKCSIQPPFLCVFLRIADIIEISVSESRPLIPHPPSTYTVDLCLHQGVTKRCRLSWLTNSDLVYETKCGGSCGVSANEYSSQLYTRAQINFGDLAPYLTYGLHILHICMFCEGATLY